MQLPQPSRALIAFTSIALLIFALSSPASAYVSFGNGYGSKWGDPNFGTPGVVTWSYMLDTTTADPSFRMDPFGSPNSTGVVGTSRIGDLRARVDGEYGAGAFDGAIQRALNTWSTVANIQFVGPVTDGGQPFASPGATTPDIRIGAFVPEEGHSFNFVGGVGFGPPGPFGNDPLAGDIILNFDAIFRVEPGVEDQTPLPTFGNDLEGLVLHELGHAAIGLGHPSWEGATPDQRVMYVGDYENPAAPYCCETVNRFPAPDDIAGAQYTYGAPTTPGPRAGDLSLDGIINRHDAAEFARHFGQPVALWTTGDFNFTGATDLADLAILQARFTVGGSNAALALPTSAVPEPTSIMLVVSGFLLVAIRRKRIL
jgi:hypothetical protein